MTRFRRLGLPRQFLYVPSKMAVRSLLEIVEADFRLVEFRGIEFGQRGVI